VAQLIAASVQSAKAAVIAPVVLGA
jgi:hypothetical protein